MQQDSSILPSQAPNDGTGFDTSCLTAPAHGASDIIIIIKVRRQRKLRIKLGYFHFNLNFDLIHIIQFSW